jgi:murein DD-endopeptidase MepM/ murein hydrolase activator NlpD
MTRLLLVGLALVLSACQVPEAVRRMGDVAPTPHERYANSLREAGLDSTALGREWLVAADTALRAAHPITLPFREAGYYDRSEARAVAWSFELREGSTLAVELTREGLPAQLFVDLYEVTADTARPFRHRVAGERDSALVHEARESSRYVLRVQPELLRSGKYEISIRTNPMLAFPVDGRGNGAVQSFFGAERDGGRREHHGIDIFAPRGTPVLAVADGYVRNTRPSNLGGNLVWLVDERRGQSLYYAHLDSTAVQQGQRVRVGDTIGFVGNSGNARTTAPHLHFGIYRRGRGPIDPYPYVRRVTATAPTIRADTVQLGVRAKTRVASAVVRTAPLAAADTVRRVQRDTPVWIVGAASTWYRVLLDDGQAGYLTSGAVRQ